MNDTNKIILIVGAVLATVISIYVVIAYSEPVKPDAAEAGIITENDWTRGNPNAKVSIVEYSDLQCPACAMVHKTIMKPFLDDYSDRVYYAYRHYPLSSIHPFAMTAARSAEAAGSQGKFWEMQDMLFEKQNEWTNQVNPESLFAEYAEDLGVDMEKYQAVFNSSAPLEKIDSDLGLAVSAGLNYTPSIIVNGELIENPRTIEDFQKLVDEIMEEEESDK